MEQSHRSRIELRFKKVVLHIEHLRDKTSKEMRGRLVCKYDIESKYEKHLVCP